MTQGALFLSALHEVLGVDVHTMDLDATAELTPGWNSMTHMELASRLEKVFGIQFPLLDVVKVRRLRDWRALVIQHGVPLDP